MKKIIIFTISILLTFFILFSIFKYYSQENVTISTEKIPNFTVKKVLYYSGISPESNFISNTQNWNLDISQYTDIAIYLENDNQELNDSNTVKKLYLDNFKIENKPKLGNPVFYYQPPFNFATNTIIKNNLINHHLTYSILNFENNEDTNYYATPNFFADCSIPITLKYLNPKIVKNYTLNNDETLFFNGKILQNSNINLNDLETIISFDINLVSNLDVLYQYTIKTEIPLTAADGSKNLFDDNITLEKNINKNFNIIKK